MSLQTVLKNKLSETDMAWLAKQMGYGSVDKLQAKITHTVECQYLGLDKNTFDFLYTQPEFIRRLSLVLDINSLFFNAIINEIQVELTRKKEKFTPYIFVETNFKRTTQPLFSLAFCESMRYIAIDKAIGILTLNQQLSHIQNLVTRHFQEHPHVPVWGEVKHYIYFYDEKLVLKLSPSGAIEDAVTDYSTARAVLSLRG
jgi:hypothetical protein